MDLSFLKPLYDRPGPHVSIYADLTRRTEEDPKRTELRWRALREELAARDAPRETVRAAERAVEEELDRAYSGGFVVFAAAGDVVFAERTAAPRAELAGVAPLPNVMPYLAQRGEPVPHVVAVVDRLGAEIDAVTAAGERHVTEVREAENYPVRKTKAGDWNQSRFQRASEEVWKANAKKIGREVGRAAERCRAETVLIAGDVHARTAVLEELPQAVLTRTVESERGARVQDAAGERRLREEVDRVIELRVTERAGEVVQEFDRELARGGRAVEGLAATVEALRRAQVQSLLVTGDVEARLWVGPDPVHLATDPTELRKLNVDEPTEDRADAALVRTLAATDAELILLPNGGLRAGQGIGAVLRYTDGPGRPTA